MDGLTDGRPRLIEPMYCKNFSMVGVTVQNPPFWAMHPYACDNLLFENVTFSAPPNSPNTDGIDPDSCSNVVIRNFNVLHCGDDAVAIKSGKDSPGRDFGMPSYNILIEGIHARNDVYAIEIFPRDVQCSSTLIIYFNQRTFYSLSSSQAARSAPRAASTLGARCPATCITCSCATCTSRRSCSPAVLRAAAAGVVSVCFVFC